MKVINESHHHHQVWLLKPMIQKRSFALIESSALPVLSPSLFISLSTPNSLIHLSLSLMHSLTFSLISLMLVLLSQSFKPPSPCSSLTRSLTISERAFSAHSIFSLAREPSEHQMILCILCLIIYMRIDICIIGFSTLSLSLSSLHSHQFSLPLCRNWLTRFFLSLSCLLNKNRYIFRDHKCHQTSPAIKVIMETQYSSFGKAAIKMRAYR